MSSKLVELRDGHFVRANLVLQIKALGDDIGFSQPKLAIWLAGQELKGDPSVRWVYETEKQRDHDMLTLVQVINSAS